MEEESSVHLVPEVSGVEDESRHGGVPESKSGELLC